MTSGQAWRHFFTELRFKGADLRSLLINPDGALRNSKTQGLKMAKRKSRKDGAGTSSEPKVVGSAGPAILFDLDGTLVDSNYEHVLAWSKAMRASGLNVPNASIHRCRGMWGEMLIQTLA